MDKKEISERKKLLCTVTDLLEGRWSIWVSYGWYCWW